MTKLKNIDKVYIHKAENLDDFRNLKSRTVFIIKYKSLFFNKTKTINFENEVTCTSWSSLGDTSYTTRHSEEEDEFRKKLEDNNINIIYGTFKGKEVNKDEFYDIYHNDNTWSTGDLKTNKTLAY